MPPSSRVERIHEQAEGHRTADQILVAPLVSRAVRLRRKSMGNAMTDKTPVNAYDQLRLTRQENGDWKVELYSKGGGLSGAFGDTGKTLDEVVAKIKQKYDVY